MKGPSISPDLLKVFYKLDKLGANEFSNPGAAGLKLGDLTSNLRTVTCHQLGAAYKSSTKYSSLELAEIIKKQS